MAQANNNTPSGEDKKTPPSRQEFFLDLWKDNKTVLGFLIYLYLSAVGYTYDVVYYQFGYGLSVVKYVAFDDLVFSVLKNGIVIVWSLVSLIILALVLFIATRIAMWLHRRRGSIRAAFRDYCRLARDSFKFLWSAIETLYEHAVRALAASLAPITSRARQLVLSVPTWLRWLFWLLTYPVHRTISIVVVGLFIILARILYYVTRPIVGALRLIAPITAPLMWAGTMLLPVVPFLLIAFFFVGPFWIASSVAQQASANPSAPIITVCTRWPQECHKGLTHIGSMGRFALFTKGGEPNGKGESGLWEVLTVYLWKWPTKTTDENLVIIPLDNMSAFHGAEAPPLPRKPTAAELLERQVLPDIRNVLDSLASLTEDPKTVVGSEIGKITASLPKIEEALASLPEDTKNLVGPEIGKITASLPKIEEALASLPEDTKNLVGPEIDKATASLPKIEEALASLPEDTKKAVVPEIKKAAETIFVKVDRLAPEIPVFRHVLVERTTRRVTEVRYSLAGFAEGQYTLDPRQIGWLTDVYASIVACRSAQKRPQLVLVGYASSQTFTSRLGERLYRGLCRVDEGSTELTHDGNPDSPLKNCYLANRRMAQVAAFLTKPFTTTEDASEPVMRKLNNSCVKRDGMEAISPGLTARPWCSLGEMIRARAKNPQTGNQPDFFNRSVHIVVKNSGGCTPFGDGTK